MSTIRDIKSSNRNISKFHIEFFESADEVVRTCTERKITDSLFHDYSKEELRQRWHGVKTYAEALEMMRTGYQPTVDSMKNIFKANAGESKRFKFQNNIQGFAPIVPLALKGVPNSMLDMQMKPIKAKVLDIYYNIAVSCSMTPEQLISAGQKILGTIIELEQQGYRFNLYAIQAYARGDCDMLVVKLKSANQPLDLKRVSFPLTHPAFFRVIGFDWYSKCPGAKYRCGYGSPLSMQIDSNDMPKLAKELFGNNALLFNGQDIIYKDKKSIQETITNAERKDR